MSFALALGLFAAASASAQTYTVVDLGSLSPSDTFAFSVSDSSRVAGYSSFPLSPGPGYTRHGFLWQQGQMQDLGTLVPGGYSWATDINEAGQISGHADSASGDEHSILYKDGSMQDLGWPGLGSEGRGLNDLTQVVGYFVTEDFQLHAGFWSQSTGFQDLTSRTRASQGLAEDLNDHTQAVGWSHGEPCGGPNGLIGPRATLWEPSSESRAGWTATDLGTLGAACWSQAYRINESGQIVGNSGGFTETATLWQKTAGGTWSIQSLGTLGNGGSSTAYGINNRGQIVGKAQLAAFGAYHAILWQCGAMIDLNSRIPANSGWELATATSINDLGEIVGYGKLNGGSSYRAVLLKPSTTNCCGLTAIPVSPVEEEEVSGNPG
jgi:probable HAF family extracellular repeat protein